VGAYRSTFLTVLNTDAQRLQSFHLQPQRRMTLSQTLLSVHKATNQTSRHQHYHECTCSWHSSSYSEHAFWYCFESRVEAEIWTTRTYLVLQVTADLSALSYSYSTATVIISYHIREPCMALLRRCLVTPHITYELK